VLGADQTLALRIAVPLSGGDRPIRLAALSSLKESAGENWGLFVRDQETLVRHRNEPTKRENARKLRAFRWRHIPSVQRTSKIIGGL